MKRRAFDVDLPGLLEVFGGHLYSTPAVFLRELVQNGVDAIVARRRLEPDFEGRVRVFSDPATHVVRVEDDGVGLDEAGIESCLATIGYSSKGDDAFLGHFGIGLLASFLVADEVVAETLRLDGTPIRWRARSDGTYTMEPGERTSRGTTVSLTLTADHRRFAEHEALRTLCLDYVRYLPFVIEHEGTRISERAPWLASGREAAIRQWLTDEPLLVLPVDRGALWIGTKRAQRGGRMDLYVRGMPLARGAAELLPAWATFVCGVIDAPELAPTASRETFVDDENAAALRRSLSRALLRGLAEVAEERPETFRQVLAIHYLELRGACVESPELLEVIGDKIPFATNGGEVEISTIARTSDGTIHYVDTPQDFSHTAQLANAQGMVLVDASYVHDVPFLEAYTTLRQGALVRLSADRMGALIRPAPELSERFASVLEVARATLRPLGIVPELGRFEPAGLSAFLLSDAAATNARAQELLQRTSSSLLRGLLGSHASAPGVRFVLNVNNPLVLALPHAVDDDDVRRVTRLLYAQASILLHRSLSASAAQSFSDDLLALLQTHRAEPSHLH